MNVIELTDITFAYEPGEPPVIKHLDLLIPQGTCLAVEGENGSGKTTLFRPERLVLSPKRAVSLQRDRDHRRLPEE